MAKNYVKYDPGVKTSMEAYLCQNPVERYDTDDDGWMDAGYCTYGPTTHSLYYDSAREAAKDEEQWGAHRLNVVKIDGAWTYLDDDSVVECLDEVEDFVKIIGPTSIYVCDRTGDAAIRTPVLYKDLDNGAVSWYCTDCAGVADESGHKHGDWTPHRKTIERLRNGGCKDKNGNWVKRCEPRYK
jgi:hypothetical protein